MHSLTTFITVRNARAAIAFYKKAFGAKDVEKPLLFPDGSVAHAQLSIGDSRLMMADESAMTPTKSPETLSGSTAGINLYVADADAVFKRALAAGAKVIFPLADQFYGDRSGRVMDPFGHHWIVSTHLEDVPMAEMKKRMAKLSDS